MSELAGRGVPDWLPAAVAMRMHQADAHEAVADRAAEAAAEQRREELRQRHMGLYVQQAEQRGELVSAVALATGQVPGRTVADILAAGAAAGDRDDVIAAARLHRDGHGDPERVHIDVGEPRLLPARSETGLKIFNRMRHFTDMLDQRQRARDAERAAEASVNDIGLPGGVTLRSRKDNDRVVVVSPSRRRSGPADSGVRFR